MSRGMKEKRETNAELNKRLTRILRAKGEVPDVLPPREAMHAEGVKKRLKAKGERRKEAA